MSEWTARVPSRCSCRNNVCQLRIKAAKTLVPRSRTVLFHPTSVTRLFGPPKTCQVQFLYVVDYGESSADVTWAGSLALGANGAGDDGGSEDWILRRSTNPSTPADVSLPYPAYPLAPAGETIYVNTTGRPQVCYLCAPCLPSLARGCCCTEWFLFRYLHRCRASFFLNMKSGVLTKKLILLSQPPRRDAGSPGYDFIAPSYSKNFP